MRILLTSNPLYGHVNTMLPLAEAAARAGHQVAFATGASMSPYLARRGVRAWAVGPHSAPSGPSVDWIEYFLTAAGERMPALIDRATEWQPDLVVHDETELAGAVVALHLGARHVVHGLGLMPPIELWQILAPGIDQLILRGGGASSAEAVRDALYLQVTPSSLQAPAEERVWRRTQALRHSMGAAAPGEPFRLTWSALPYRQHVHLTLGTVFNGAVELLRAAVEGLRRLPVNVIVTVGPDGNPAELGPQPDHVVVERYLPHSLLLPQCAAVVSHGGAGVLFGALSHGLPQLVLPQGADQFANADALVRSGAGLALGPNEITPDAVTHAAERLLAEPTFTRAATAARAEMASMPDGDSIMGALASGALVETASFADPLSGAA